MKSHSHYMRITALSLLTLALFIPQPASAADTTAAAVAIKIDNFSFNPPTITVRAGTQVTWTNQDDIPYTVVSDDKTTFKSRALDTDEKFSFTFTKPGIYEYFCSIHPHMTAKVIVQ